MRLREIKGEGNCLVVMLGDDMAYAATMLDRGSQQITKWLKERHGAWVQRVPVEEARRLLAAYVDRDKPVFVDPCDVA